MLERFRVGWAKAMTPPARLFIALHLTPDMITWAGTFFTVAAALVCFPQGWLWQGVLIITAFIFSDGIDGQMARMLGRKSTWGAFLDSSLDRIGDGAVFGGIVLYYAGPGHSQLWAGIALGALVMGQVTSYVKARGEALGVQVRGGLAARADRLVLLLVAAFFTGVFNLAWLLPLALSWGFFASTVTVGQRMVQVAHAGPGRDDPTV
ncbi:MAG TPA: CDP-alcohol phosphatidyltransferase family protein [Propionibacteriaceae bacterium]|nr:CDP-alcohol phosphatidyltransferase family protein [Propionibacteriaceae bacterium]